jgi:hypothetical protein
MNFAKRNLSCRRKFTFERQLKLQHRTPNLMLKMVMNMRIPVTCASCCETVLLVLGFILLLLTAAGPWDFMRVHIQNNGKDCAVTYSHAFIYHNYYCTSSGKGCAEVFSFQNSSEYCKLINFFKF